MQQKAGIWIAEHDEMVALADLDTGVSLAQFQRARDVTRRREHWAHTIHHMRFIEIYVHNTEA